MTSHAGEADSRIVHGGAANLAARAESAQALPEIVVQAPATGLVSDFVLSPDGLTVYVADIQGVVRSYNAETGALLQSWTVGTKLGGIDVSPNGKFLIVTESQPGPTTPAGNPAFGSHTAVYAYKLDLASGTVTTYTFQAQNMDVTFHDVAILADGQAYLTQDFFGSGATSIQVLNPANGRFGTPLPGTYAASGTLTVSDDRTSLLITDARTSGGSDYLYQLGTNTVSSVGSNIVTGASGGLVAYSAANGGWIAESITTGQLLVRHGGTQVNLTQTNTALFYNSGMGFDETASNLYVIVDAPGGKSLLQLATSDWHVVQTIPLPSDQSFFNSELASEVVVGPDSRFFMIYAGAALLRIDNPAVADALVGTAGADVIQGTPGNDVIIGFAGADFMTGGTGDDRYYVDSAADTVNENPGEGFDTIRTSVNFVLGSGIDVERLETTIRYGNDAIDITGNVIANQIHGNSGINRLSGGGGNDQLFGFEGNDVLIGGSGADEIDGGAGADTLYSGDLLTGTGIYDPTIYDRGLEHDKLTGGAGDDILWFGYGDDADGGDGTDILWLSLESGTAGATIDVSDSTIVNSVGGGTIRNIEQVGAIIGTAFADHFTVGYQTLGAALVNGGDGDDVLSGTTGVVFLNGGNGKDVITGSSDRDTLHGDAGDDTIFGGGGVDAIWGDDGDDKIDGGADDDFMRGGAGNDEYIVGSFSDRVFEVAGQGYDHVITSNSWTIEGGQEIELLTAANVPANAILQLTGNELANQIEGHAGANVLKGGGGADVLIAFNGNDSLDGGTGADTLVGGRGNDSYFVDTQDDAVFEYAGEGTDTVTASASFYLYANIENLTLAAGAGNAFGVGNGLANIINGNQGVNLILGGGGNDEIHGGANDDQLYGEDGVDTIFGDAGVDYLIGGAGNDILMGGNDSDALYGEGGDDFLQGGDDFKTDILIGGEGNDTLHGDSGLGDYDEMDGGAGNDSYYVDTYADVTYEAADGGTDTVFAGTAAGSGYYLYANVENLTLTGATFYGVGNDLANTMIGTASANWLLGGAGNDVLNGKAGNDVLFGQDGADTFVFEAGTGGDTIADFTAGTDRIDLSAFGFTTFAQVQAVMVENDGVTAIQLSATDFVVLQGVGNAALHAGDFILAGGSQGTQTIEQRTIADDDSVAVTRADLIHQLDVPNMLVHF